MRKINQRSIIFIVLTLFLFVFLTTNLPQVSALDIQGQTLEPGGDVFTFAQLGYVEKMMVSPYDTLQIPFGLPSAWELIPGAQITLNLNFASNQVQSRLGSDNFPAGILRVSFNGVIIKTIFLRTLGDMTETISIPAEALAPNLADGRYRLSFLFDSRFDCGDLAANSSLIISANSLIDLKHTLSPVDPDLTIFPRPIYQADLILPSQAAIVIPDAPSEAELRAALAISAGLGALTNGRLQYNLLPAAQFTEAKRADTNVILVGMPNNLPLLKNVSTPYPLRNGAWVLQGMEPTDGLIQAAVSPWNQTNIAVIVSANSEEGLIKAAQAVSAGNLVPTGRPDVSVISAVNPVSASDNVPENQTLLSLGYENRTLGGFEGTYASYFFRASSEQVLSTGGYVDFVTSHTNLLDSERSGISVFLNRTLVGSIKFTGEADQVTTTRLSFLPGVVRRGNNLLEIYSDLIPIYDCYSPDLSSSTVTISDSTNIHLPITAQQLELNKLLNLNDYPAMFASDRNLSDLAFIVAPNDPTGWDMASQLAFDIGESASIPVANLEAVYGNSVPQAIRDKRSLILVGRASSLPIMADFNDKLPAPFVAGGDEAVQPALLVNYRLLPNISVGYLQLLPSPWNAEKAILVVAGNTAAGVPMAAEKLTKPEFSSQLNGNFSVLYNDQVLTTDTRLGQSKEALISDLPEAALTTPAPEMQPTPSALVDGIEIETRPAWVLPALVALSAITLLMLLVLAWRAVVNRKKDNPRPGKGSGQ